MKSIFVLVVFLLLMGVSYPTGIGSCQVISASDSYTLTADLTGAPNSASEMPDGGLACVKILASDVVLDCDGHYIINDGTGGTTYGIAVPSEVSNVTIQNCPGISGYSNGIFVYQSAIISLINDAAMNNSNTGLYIQDSDQTVVQGQYFSNNTNDLIVHDDIGNPFSVSLSGMIFDNPSGTMENYTNLSVNDTLNDVGGFSISWMANDTPTPRESFIQKFVRIDLYASPPLTIDSAVWSWTATEALGYNESNLSLWNGLYGGYWYVVNETPDTSSHTLALTNFTPAGEYGILQGGIISVGCPVISSGGTYTQGMDYVGEPNDASPLAGSACVEITASDVVYNCNGHSITNGGTGGPTYGILLVGPLTDVTVENCPWISRYEDGIYANQSDGSEFTNINAYYNRGAGIVLDSSDSNALHGNDFSNNSFSNANGIYLNKSNNNRIYDNHLDYDSDYSIGLGGYNNDTDSSSNNVIYDNSIDHNNDYGIFFGFGSNNNTLYNNSVSNDSNIGLVLDTSSNNTIANNTFTNGGYSAIALYSSSDQNTLDDNSIYNNEDAIALDNSSQETISGNRVNNNSYGGIHSSSPPTDNTAIYNNDLDGNNLGIEITGSNNNITNNSCDNESYEGIGLSGGNNTLSNNSADNNGDDGIGLGGDNNTLYGNSADNNAWDGIGLYGGNNSLSNNSADNNGHTGITISGTNNSMDDNRATNNSHVGLSMGSDQTSVTGQYLSNNGYDLDVADYSGPPITINLSGIVFDNPTGSMENFTNLSINDIVNNGEEYAINWTANETAPPYQPFAQTFVNISALSPPVSIDSIVWSWTDGEANGYDQSTFQLWVYNSSGWTPLNVTPDLSSDTLALTDLSPGSDYGIFGNSTINCPVINESGTYTQDMNYTGAPNGAPELSGTVCVKIAASDVVFDCNGYSIANNGTAGTTFGIAINGSLTNVTVENCAGISGYYYGIYTGSLSGGDISNNSVYNDTDTCIASLGTGNVYSNNSVSQCFNGFYASGASASIFSGNTVYNDSYAGFRIESGASDNTFTDNVVLGNADYGFYLGGLANNNSFSGNNVSGGSEGFHLISCENNTFTGNNAYNNTLYGFAISCTNDTYLYNNAYNNTQYGFRLFDANGNTFIGNSAYNNTGSPGNPAYGMAIISQFGGSAGNQFWNTTLFRNDYDFYAYSNNGVTYNMANTTFLDPSGSMANTSLSINDSLAAGGESYTINWSRNSTALPASAPISFNKFVDIKNQSAGVSIDSVTWSWQDSELSGYNDTKFELWESDASGWTRLNNTPDTVADTLGFTGLIPSSTYGILQNNVTTIPTINLMFPPDAYITNSGSIDFAFNASDDYYPTLSCSLYLDGNLNQTNATTQNSTATDFPLLGIADGYHNWFINCTDLANETNFSETRSFTVDTIPPVISGISNITQTATNLTNNVTYSPTAKDEYNVSVPVICNPVSGSMFPIGNTTVNCNATDIYGNTANASFRVTENPGTTPPTISGISNINDTATNYTGSTETYSPTATDEYNVSVPVICNPVSGSMFPIGNTTVNCTATDIYGNQANESFNVTENPGTVAPIISGISNINDTATNYTGSTETYSPTAKDEYNVSVPVICNPVSGSMFPIGNTTVNCTATDIYGNQANESFNVTENPGTTPPTFSGISNINDTATNYTGSTETYSPTAKDEYNVSVPVLCTPVSGSLFPIGNTTVNCNATDIYGNTANASFRVTENPGTTPPTISGISNITQTATNLTNNVTYSPTATDEYNVSVPVICNPVSGSMFPIGNTTVNCNATDIYGNTANASFRVTENPGTTPPTISGISNITQTATNLTNNVTYSPTATDEYNVSVPVICNPVSGSMFPIGNTTVNCTATDIYGNQANESFNVTENPGTVAPIISGISNINDTATNYTGSTETYSPTAKDEYNVSVPVLCTPVSGSLFPIGNTTVNCNATDIYGNTANASFRVTENPGTTPPTISGISNITQTATNLTNNVTYSPTAKDEYNVSVPVLCTPVSGSLFPIGNTTVNCNATDIYGNTANASFRVTENPGTTPPTISGISNITNTATNLTNNVTYSPTAKDEYNVSVPVLCTPVSGSLFPIGNTTVNCNATDIYGNTANASFRVTENPGTTPPTISGISNINVTTATSNGTIETYAPTAKDEYNVSINVSCVPPSGSMFPIGTTPVNCSATDPYGNTANASFNVTVNPIIAPLTLSPSSVAQGQSLNGTITGLAPISPFGSVIISTTYNSSPLLTTAPIPALSLLEASNTSLGNGIVLVDCPFGSAQFTPPGYPGGALDNITCLVSTSFPTTSIGTYGLTVSFYTSGNGTGNPSVISTGTLTVVAVPPIPPTISGISNITNTATNLTNNVTYSPTAKDEYNVSVPVICNPVSGSMFPIGNTTVNCNATDIYGNTANASFRVTENPGTTPPTISGISNITQTATNLTNNVTYSPTAKDEYNVSVPVICNPVSGSMFPIGNTTVNCNATDIYGNTANASFRVTENPGTTPPTISGISNITNTATNLTNNVTYSPTAKDEYNVSVPVICNPVSGSMFPIGNTTVNCNATDIYGNTANASFRVTENPGTTPPTISGISNITQTATNLTNNVTYSPTAKDEYNVSVPVLCTPVSGSLFPIGNTTVNCNATDIYGNTANASFRVTENPGTTPPTISGISNITQTATNLTNNVTYSPTATDEYNVSVPVLCTPVSGSLFPIGNTTVNCNATDIYGNTANASFRVTENPGTTPPTISGISNITQTATNLTNNVTYSPTAKDEYNVSVPVLCTPVSGSLFPIGNTTVNCNATDIYGNTANASFRVTENPGTTPPTISGISNITDTTANPLGATEIYTPTATDEYGQLVNVSCTPVSGSLFPIGTTQVNCTATDAYSNTANASFNVTEILSVAPSSPPSGGVSLAAMSLSYSIAPCPANQVTITSSSGEGANIRLLLTSPYGGLVEQQTTGSDGTATFSLAANGTYEADASRSGYRPTSITFAFTTCPAATANITPPITPVAPVNQTLNCTSDADCADNQLCNIPPGANMGNCQNITGCGKAANHVLVPYQCGSGSNCPQCGYGQMCMANICRSFDLTGPSSGFVGENTSVQAMKDNSVCMDCDIRITDPTGNVISGKTDSAGDFSLQLVYAGAYDVSYIENGTVVRTLQIEALPGAAPVQQPPHPSTTAGFNAGLVIWPLLLLVLVIIIAAIAYWMLRSKPKGSYGSKGPKRT